MNDEKNDSDKEFTLLRKMENILVKTVIDKKLISQVQDLKETKNLSITEIAKVTGRGRTTIYKVLKEELNYIPYNRLVKNVNQEAVNEGK